MFWTKILESAHSDWRHQIFCNLMGLKGTETCLGYRPVGLRQQFGNPQMNLDCSTTAMFLERPPQKVNAHQDALASYWSHFSCCSNSLTTLAESLNILCHYFSQNACSWYFILLSLWSTESLKSKHHQKWFCFSLKVWFRLKSSYQFPIWGIDGAWPTDVFWHRGESQSPSYAVLYLIHELTLAWQTFIIPEGEKQSKSTLGGLADSCT